MIGFKDSKGKQNILQKIWIKIFSRINKGMGKTLGQKIDLNLTKSNKKLPFKLNSTILSREVYSLSVKIWLITEPIKSPLQRELHKCPEVDFGYITFSPPLNTGDAAASYSNKL